MTRLVLVMPAFPRPSETFLLSKVRGLRDRGWDVQVVTGRTIGDWESFEDARRDVDLRERVHRMPPVRPHWLAVLMYPVVLSRCLLRAPGPTLRYLWRGAKRLGIRVLRDLYVDSALVFLRPDLVHFEYGALAPGRLHIRDLLGVPLTVSFRGHDVNFVGLEDPDFYSELWSVVDGVHLLGSDLWERARRRGAPEDLPHALVAPAVDPDAFRVERRTEHAELGTPDRPLRVLSVGRLYWTKGYDYALESVAELKRRGVHIRYRIVGDGEYVHAVWFWRHQLDLYDCVDLVGDVDHEDIPIHLAWADLFLHAAVSEGFCNAVLEAQASGLPVVCTDADGLSENVDDGVTGLVVPRRDPHALADALSSLASDADLRLSMAKSGPERVRERFALPDQLDRIEDFYRDVLARSASYGIPESAR